jgi:hypothetical protein
MPDPVRGTFAPLIRRRAYQFAVSREKFRSLSLGSGTASAVIHRMVQLALPMETRRGPASNTSGVRSNHP